MKKIVIVAAIVVATLCCFIEVIISMGNAASGEIRYSPGSFDLYEEPSYGSDVVGEIDGINVDFFVQETKPVLSEGTEWVIVTSKDGVRGYADAGFTLYEEPLVPYLAE